MSEFKRYLRESLRLTEQSLPGGESQLTAGSDWNNPSPEFTNDWDWYSNPNNPNSKPYYDPEGDGIVNPIDDNPNAPYNFETTPGFGEVSPGYRGEPPTSPFLPDYRPAPGYYDPRPFDGGAPTFDNVINPRYYDSNSPGWSEDGFFPGGQTRPTHQWNGERWEPILWA